MVGLQFFLGLGLGLGVCTWNHYRWQKNLRGIVNSFSSNDDRTISLPPVYLVRREMENLRQESKLVTQERDGWQRLIDQAPIGYLLVDEENQLLWCNQQARILLKLDRWRWGEVRLLLELVRSYELDRLIEETRKSQQPQTKDWIYYFTRHAIIKDSTSEANSSSFGSTEIVKAIALSGHAFPLVDRQVGIFLVNRQPFVDLSSSRDRSTSDLAHELKTPLTSISLVAENLLTRLQNPELRWVEQMLKDTNRLISLVREWLDITQLEESPLQNIHYEQIFLLDLISSIWQTLEPIARKRNIKLVTNNQKDLVIEGDKSRLIQVFLNLLDNAIKHTPKQGNIIVDINLESELLDQPPKSQDSQFAIIDIVDSGQGFVSSDLPYVFERLYRGDASRHRPANIPGGSGLGLTIVQQIVQAHGGSIKAKNHPQSGGAWLRVKLPQKKAKSP